MKRRYDDGTDDLTTLPSKRILTSNARGTTAANLPFDILYQIFEYLIPPTSPKPVNYLLDKLSPWDPIVSLSRCCRHWNSAVTDIVYGSKAPFVFDINVSSSLGLFLLHLRPETAAKVKAMQIHNPGGHGLDVCFDLLLTCSSLESLVITGYALAAQQHKSLQCFRLQTFELPMREGASRPCKLREDILSWKPRTRRQQARLEETVEEKVSPSKYASCHH